ncbi:MAG: hypothetical protein AAB527_03580 [Patescibacteria group bacterium]
MENQNNFNLPVAIVVSAFILSGAWIYSQKPSSDNKAAVFRDDEPHSESETVLPVKWGDLGLKMISVGVIDPEKFESLYSDRGGLTDDTKRILYEENNGNLKITPKNSGEILNLLWALGLGNKNDVLDKGPMKDPRYGGVGDFASVGGWILADSDAVNHYSRHPLIMLTRDQQALVERVAKNVYRPCCKNSTYFPDCNHGMAMLGLLELMASQGVSEKEMYDSAAKVNAYWFPELNQNAGSPCAVEAQPQTSGCAI